LAATDDRMRGVDGRHQMLFGMEIVPAHARTTDPGEERNITLSNIRSLVKPVRSRFGRFRGSPTLLTPGDPEGLRQDVLGPDVPEPQLASLPQRQLGLA
jgi:hypothetical protein